MRTLRIYMTLILLFIINCKEKEKEDPGIFSKKDPDLRGHAIEVVEATFYGVFAPCKLEYEGFDRNGSRNKNSIYQECPLIPDEDGKWIENKKFSFGSIPIVVPVYDFKPEWGFVERVELLYVSFYDPNVYDRDSDFYEWHYQRTIEKAARDEDASFKIELISSIARGTLRNYFNENKNLEIYGKKVECGLEVECEKLKRLADEFSNGGGNYACIINLDLSLDTNNVLRLTAAEFNDCD